MNNISIAEEVAFLMSIRPTIKELDEAISSCEAVLKGIKRGRGGYRVDARLSPYVAAHPEACRRELRRSRKAALIVRSAIAHAA